MGLITADLRDVRYFAAVVEQGSLSRAADVLKVSQPTLSHAIARLEDSLGGAVWRRTGNRRAGVVPTELGQRVLERGGRALAELDALSKDAAQLRGLEAGELRVGCVQSLASTVLPAWVSRFLEEHPAIVLELPLVTSESAAGLVRDGKLDAALVVGPAPAEPHLKRLRCGEQELVLVVRSDHALARDREVALAELAEEPFVFVPAGTFAAVAIEELCRRAGFTPRVRARLASISGLCALVRAGVGITILPEGSVSAGERDLVEIKFARAQPRRAVHLVWRADVLPSPALSAWLKMGSELVAPGKPERRR
ncbi:MAG: LysR family transcriptional regulator [Myxococcales bacterium]